MQNEVKNHMVKSMVGFVGLERKKRKEKERK